MKKYKCTHIDYDVSYEDAASDLYNLNHKDPTDTEVEEHIKLIKSRIPATVVVGVDTDGLTDDEIEYQIGEEISNATGWLHKRFEYKEVK